MSDAAQTMVPGAAVRGRGALAKAAGPVLSMLFVLRRTNDLDSLRDVQVAVISQIEEFRRTARDLGIGSGDIEDATYAIAATFDETMLTRQWQGRESWQSQSLAQRYCQNEFVGLGFYDKLAQVRANLARVNPAVRREEVEAIETQMEALHTAIPQAGPRLDALRFICSADFLNLA